MDLRCPYLLKSDSFEICFGIGEVLSQGFGIISKGFLEKGGGEYGGEVFLSCIIQITAPSVLTKIFQSLSRTFDSSMTALAPEFCTGEVVERIEVNVVQYVIEVRVVSYKDFLRASLKERPDPFVFLVE